jgi:hypothetical protein
VRAIAHEASLGQLYIESQLLRALSRQARRQRSDYSVSLSRSGFEMPAARAKGIARLRMLSITGRGFLPCKGDFGKAS